MGKEHTARGSVLKMEADASQFIPYTCHIDPWTVKTKEGDLVQVLKIEGVSHETSDIAEINAWYEGRNNVYRNIADAKRSIWTTIIREEHNQYPQDNYSPGFSKLLNAKYKHKISQEKLYVNSMYIAIVQRNTSVVPLFGGLIRRLRSSNRSVERQQELEAVKSLHDAVENVVKALGRYEPTRLSVYEQNGHKYSQVYEYFGQLINGRYQRIPLARSDASRVLCNTRLSFGNEAIELRNVSQTKIGATLGLKEYCDETGPGMLDGLLALPFCFVLSQSFTFISKPTAVRLMKLQRDRMEQSADLAESQIDQIEDALDELTSSRFVMGDHHLTFTAFGETATVVQKHLAAASNAFAEMGFITAREDLALEAAFWSQLPGNQPYRPRKAPITSRNFAGLMSFHNYPTGHIDSNWWGPAVSLFKTISGTPYYFNFHRGRHENPLGNATIIGPSGTGKTVLMGFTMAQCEKYQPKVVFFDKDRGAEIFIRAQGGHYTPIQEGKRSGFNPFQMEATPKNITFMNQLIKILVTRNGEAFSVEDQTEIDSALQGLLGLDRHQRTLSTLVPFLDSTKEGGVAKRLRPWYGQSDNAWLFDNEEDSLNLDARLLGFDITDLLNRPAIRTPALLYLFHRVEQLINGQKLMIYIEEAWKAIEDPVFQPIINDWLKTIRKRNGIIVFATQGAQDAASSDIGPSIIEQTTTNIFMPNPKAKREDHVGAFNLSETEYHIIRTLPENSRQFLIKHGDNSVVAELNLAGMADEINVLSGSEANVNLLDDIRKQVGDSVKDWYPLFKERSRQS